MHADWVVRQRLYNERNLYRSGYKLIAEKQSNLNDHHTTLKLLLRDFPRAYMASGLAEWKGKTKINIVKRLLKTCACLYDSIISRLRLFFEAPLKPT